MSDFTDHWLTLRAPADRRARADHLLRWLQIDPAQGLDVLDLGCGNGANLRHLAPLLADAGAGQQRWTCVDIDPALLHQLPARTAAWAQSIGLEYSLQQTANLMVAGSDWHAPVHLLQLDLASVPRQLPLPDGGLVTASALLDLVSARWLDALLDRCHAARCQLLFALNYDGRCEWWPEHPEDAMVLDLVNRHQRTDKSFGPALGPAAAAYAAARCMELGYHIDSQPSDWHLRADQSELQRALMDGWRQAALQLDPARADRIDIWHRAHVGSIDAGRLNILVGHQDLVATTPSGDSGP
jgi:SAM-dependent methyltransferase